MTSIAIYQSIHACWASPAVHNFISSMHFVHYFVTSLSFYQTPCGRFDSFRLRMRMTPLEWANNVLLNDWYFWATTSDVLWVEASIFSSTTVLTDSRLCLFAGECKAQVLSDSSWRNAASEQHKGPTDNKICACCVQFWLKIRGRDDPRNRLEWSNGLKWFTPTFYHELTVLLKWLHIFITSISSNWRPQMIKLWHYVMLC